MQELLELWAEGYNASIIVRSCGPGSGRAALVFGDDADAGQRLMGASSSSCLLMPASGGEGTAPSGHRAGILDRLLERAFDIGATPPPPDPTRPGSSEGTGGGRGGSGFVKVGLSCWQILGECDTDLLGVALNGSSGKTAASKGGKAGCSATRVVVEVQSLDEARRVLAAARNCSSASLISRGEVPPVGPRDGGRHLRAEGGSGTASHTASDSSGPLQWRPQRIPGVLPSSSVIHDDGDDDRRHLFFQLVRWQERPSGARLSRLTLADLADPHMADNKQGSAEQGPAMLRRQMTCKQLERASSMLTELVRLHTNGKWRDRAMG